MSRPAVQMAKLEPRIVHLSPRSGVDIRRTLPHRQIRTIGAWCFVDHYGPTPQVEAMTVAAHPHTGLQTVSWLFSGAIEHCDSLGSVQRIEPGELNIMTAGHGIAHSERSLDDAGDLHGIQLWVALPQQVSDRVPMFHHHANLPTGSIGDADLTVILGTFDGARADVDVFSDIAGVQLRIPASGHTTLPLDPSWEYGIHVASGTVRVNDTVVTAGQLLFIPPGQQMCQLIAAQDAVVVLLGGEPFTEPIIMWWNFIGRSDEEIRTMREEWNSRSHRFPSFTDHVGGWIPAPELPNVTLTARPRA